VTQLGSEKLGHHFLCSETVASPQYLAVRNEARVGEFPARGLWMIETLLCGGTRRLSICTIGRCIPGRLIPVGI
jgi:hypothetical protein